MLPDFKEIIAQAEKMKSEMKKVEQELLAMKVDGEAGAGLVKITMNGHHEVIRVAIDSDLMKESKEVLEDLIAAAINDTVRKLSEHRKERMHDMTGGFQIPEGFELPF